MLRNMSMLSNVSLRNTYEKESQRLVMSFIKSTHREKNLKTPTPSGIELSWTSLFSIFWVSFRRHNFSLWGIVYHSFSSTSLQNFFYCGCLWWRPCSKFTSNRVTYHIDRNRILPFWDNKTEMEKKIFLVLFPCSDRKLMYMDFCNVE